MSSPRFLVAPDSYKESMSAAAASEAMERGIKSVFEDAAVVRMPMADGGEGLVQILTPAMGGRLVEITVLDPLGYPTRAHFGWIEGSSTAVIECAEGCGIHLVSKEDRDPSKATTFGVGQIVLKALEFEPQTIIFGLGGSATNDGGTGMLQALGARFFDSKGNLIPTTGNPVTQIAGGSVDFSNLDPRLANTKFVAACDVDNPLTGPNGASAVFGPQKGADPQMISELDQALGQLGKLMEAELGKELMEVPGTGAAGGLGLAILGPLKGELRRGIDVVLDAWKIDDYLPRTDFVFTGEGKIDGQTSKGKTPWGVAKRAAKHGVPTIAFAGSLAPGWELVEDDFAAIVAIVPGVTDLPTALAQGEENLQVSAATACKLIKAGWQHTEGA